MYFEIINTIPGTEYFEGIPSPIDSDDFLDVFVTSAPKIWNELPMYIRNLHNFSIFKKLVKTYYFEEAFNVNTSCNI
jgi:hypothetical protein